MHDCYREVWIIMYIRVWKEDPMSWIDNMNKRLEDWRDIVTEG